MRHNYKRSTEKYRYPKQDIISTWKQHIGIKLTRNPNVRNIEIKIMLFLCPRDPILRDSDTHSFPFLDALSQIMWVHYWHVAVPAWKDCIDSDNFTCGPCRKWTTLIWLIIHLHKHKVSSFWQHSRIHHQQESNGLRGGG